MSKPLTNKQAKWLSHVIAWQEQNCPGKDYASEHQIKLQNLYSWKAYFKAKGYFEEKLSTKQANRFAKLTVTSASVAPIKITFSNGSHIEMVASDLNTVSQIIDKVSKL